MAIPKPDKLAQALARLAEQARRRQDSKSAQGTNQAIREAQTSLAAGRMRIRR